jgi:hypothetical protein
VLVLLGVLEGDGDGAAHIVVLVVDRQLRLLLPVADLVVLLVLLGVELYVDLHAARQPSEEGAQLVLSYTRTTIARYRDI